MLPSLLALYPANNEEDLKDRFLRDARKKWTELDNRAVLLKTTARTAFGKANFSDVFVANDRCRMLIRKNMDGEESATLFAVNSDYAFQLKRKSDDGPWMLVDVELEKPGSNLPILPRVMARDTNMPHSMLTRLYGERLTDLVAMPEFKIRSLSSVTENASVARLEFECVHQPGEDPTYPYAVQGGTITLEPDRYWCLREGNVQIISRAGSMTMSFKIDLRENSDLPLPSHYETREEWYRKDGSPAETTTREADVEYDLTARVPNSREFRLPAFGLPEPPALSNRSGWITLFWVLNGFGLALIVLGVCYWRRKLSTVWSPKS